MTDINMNQDSQNNNSAQNTTGYNYNQYTYDPNAYSSYNQYGYDPNQNSQYNYNQSMYSSYNQYGYNPNQNNQYNYTQPTYDPNAYSSHNMQTQMPSTDPNNPMRVSVSPNTPSTNNITLNLDALKESIQNKLSEKEIVQKNIKYKDILLLLQRSNVYVNIYSNLAQIETPFITGNINTINKETISINSKIVAIKYISYIEFLQAGIEDMFIQEYFRNTNINTKRDISDFQNFLHSKQAFNQYVSITIKSTFLTEINMGVVIGVNEEVVLIKKEDMLYLIQLEQIVAIE